MLTLGDGIAIATIGGIIIAAVLRMKISKKDINGENVVYMTEKLFYSEQKNICTELRAIKDDISALFKQMRELNIYLREKK